MPRPPAATSRTLEALADALVPPGARLPGAAEVGAAARAAELIARMPRSIRRLTRFELGLLEQASRLAGAPFSRLPRRERDRVLAAVGRFPGLLADALAPLTLPVLLAYASAPEVLAALGAEPGQLLPLTAPLPPPDRLPVRSAPDLPPGSSEVFDVVIVGSGAGGAPAARAFARAGWSVAVVEEGEAFTREDFTGPELDRLRRLYRDGGATVTLGSPVIAVPVGRAVGGTTVVNSGTCLRTPDAVVASWHERYGLHDLRPDDLGPHYEEVEATLGVAPVPWAVMGNNGLIAHRGAQALGLPGRPILRNASGCRGSGVCAVGCPVDGKRGVHLNYLPQAVEAGAEIFARCRVDRVLTAGGRATGVRGTSVGPDGRPRGPFTLWARRGVVLAAGAPFTPGLLRRTGPRRGALGRGLRIHPATVAVGIFDEEVRGWRGVLQSYEIDALAHRGIVLEATFPPPSLAYAESGTARTGAERTAMLERLPNMAVLGALVSDTSSGRVWDLGPGRTPLMTYRMNRYDVRRVLEGMLLCAKVLFVAGAVEVHPMLTGAPPLRSPADADAVLGRDHPASRLRLTAYHPMGTARMGADPDGVLHADGRVKGIEHLAVVDASVFPSSLGVNPQVTIMAFASLAADRMLARW